jgi:glycosyltransferase involved in cell wall biosynthesis
MSGFCELGRVALGMTTVSLIVPCYNSALFLRATIESVLHQDRSDWQLILVDDGSQDATWEIIDQYTRLDSRILGFRKSKEGISKTRNYGFAKANQLSRYVFFLDSDDELEPGALARMAAHLDAHSDVGLLACQIQKIGTDGRKLGIGRRSRWVPGLIFPRRLRDDEVETPFVTFFCTTGQGPFAMYRRLVYVQTEGWDTTLRAHEDTDMFCQMALLSNVHCLPDRLYRKRVHPAEVTSDGVLVQRSYVRFRSKWDNREAKNAHEASLLRNAKSYYYRVHKPFRDLKVAWAALLKFLAHPSFRGLQWCMQLIASALRGFLIKRRDIGRQ